MVMLGDWMKETGTAEGRNASHDEKTTGAPMTFFEIRPCFVSVE